MTGKWLGPLCNSFKLRIMRSCIGPQKKYKIESLELNKKQTWKLSGKKKKKSKILWNFRLSFFFLDGSRKFPPKWVMFSETIFIILLLFTGKATLLHHNKNFGTRPALEAKLTYKITLVPPRKKNTNRGHRK